MIDYIKDYFRVSKLLIHYQRFYLVMKIAFALIIICSGNIQWMIFFTIFLWTDIMVPGTYFGIGYILPLTDEERIKRQITGMIVPMFEYSICGAVGKVLQYLLISKGIIGSPDTSVLVRYPVFSAVFFMVSVIAAADFTLYSLDGFIYQEKTKKHKKKIRKIARWIFNDCSGGIFLIYGVAITFNIRKIFDLDDLGSYKHVIRMLIIGVLLSVDIVWHIRESLTDYASGKE